MTASPFRNFPVASRMMLGAGLAIIVGVLLVLAPAQSTGGVSTRQETIPIPRRPVILLVQGIQEDAKAPMDIWGLPLRQPTKQTRWSGMIGFLEAQGFVFGGVVRPKDGKPLDLAECLDRHATVGDPKQAELFALAFSPSPQVEGLMSRADELAAVIRELCVFTGRKKVRLVAHSAGGLAARLYLQGEIRSAPYRHDVDRLITIATPHLGSVLASRFGKYFLGERGDALGHQRPRIINLNEIDELPGDVNFASIVVRGYHTDQTSRGADYDHLVDASLLGPMPPDFKFGGDGRVQVRSQNLALAKCARRYEATTKKAIQYAVARVPTASELPHITALSDPDVQQLVAAFLGDGDGCWTGKWTNAERRRWLAHQSFLCALDTTERELKDLSTTIKDYDFQSNDFLGCAADQWTYRFRFEGKWKSTKQGTAWVAGTQTITSDAFGRVRGQTAKIAERKWVYAKDHRPELTEQDLVARGLRHLADGETSLATRKLKRALDLGTADERAAEGLLKCCLLGAKAYCSADDHGGAADHMLRGVVLLPKDKLEAWRAKETVADLYSALSHHHARDYSKAIECYRGAITHGEAELRPGCAALLGKAHYARGLELFDTKADAQAVRHFDEALKYLPDHYGGRLTRGHSRCHTGEAALAKVDFEDLIKRQPYAHEAYSHLARLYAACPKEQFRNGAMALELAHTALDLSRGKDASVFTTLAMVHANLGQFDAAVSWQAKALADDGYVKALAPGVRAELEQRSRDYQSGQPYRFGTAGK